MDKEKDRITRLLDNQLIKVFDPINAEYVEGYITGKSAEDLAEIILPQPQCTCKAAEDFCPIHRPFPQYPYCYESVKDDKSCPIHRPQQEFCECPNSDIINEIQYCNACDKPIRPESKPELASEEEIEKKNKVAIGIIKTTLSKRKHKKDCSCAYCFTDKTAINALVGKVGKIEPKKEIERCVSHSDTLLSSGYNQALHDFRLYQQKCLGELEEVITNSYLSKMVGDKYIKNHKGAEFGVTLWGTAIDELAQAIRNLFGGKDE